MRKALVGCGAGAVKQHERANAEVQWQPCRCAGSPVKAVGLSLRLAAESYLSYGMIILHAYR